MTLKLVKPEYGTSPAMIAARAMRRLNAMYSPEAQTYQLCISFWESRKVRGPLSVFYFAHNRHCTAKADFYRAMLKTFLDKRTK